MTEIPTCHEPGQMRCNVCGMLPIKPTKNLVDKQEFGERIIRMIENEERIGRWSTEIVTDIIRSNYTPVCIGEV